MVTNTAKIHVMKAHQALKTLGMGIAIWNRLSNVLSSTSGGSAVTKILLAHGRPFCLGFAMDCPLFVEDSKDGKLARPNSLMRATATERTKGPYF